MIETLREIASKLWSVGKLAIPGVALFELVSWLFSKLIAIFNAYLNSLIDALWGKITAQMQVLAIDLTPSAEFMAFISKANVVIPLSEMWHYFLLYLGVASVVLGVKWARNLIPGVS